MTLFRRQQIPLQRWGWHVANTTERDAIAFPLKGMVVFVDDDDEMFMYDGSAWELIPTGGGGGVSLATTMAVSSLRI